MLITAARCGVCEEVIREELRLREVVLKPGGLYMAQVEPPSVEEIRRALETARAKIARLAARPVEVRTRGRLPRNGKRVTVAAHVTRPEEDTMTEVFRERLRAEAVEEEARLWAAAQELVRDAGELAKVLEALGQEPSVWLTDLAAVSPEVTEVAVGAPGEPEQASGAEPPRALAEERMRDATAPLKKAADNRQRIKEFVLAQPEPVRLGAIVEGVGMSQPPVSRHLRTLVGLRELTCEKAAGGALYGPPSSPEAPGPPERVAAPESNGTGPVEAPITGASTDVQETLRLVADAGWKTVLAGKTVVVFDPQGSRTLISLHPDKAGAMEDRARLRRAGLPT